MSQNSLVLANTSRTQFRTNVNNAFDTVATLFSGATEPSTTVAYQWWADTTAGFLKQRNAANNGWLNRFSLSFDGLSASNVQAETALISNTINERTGSAGVTIDGVRCRDSIVRVNAPSDPSVPSEGELWTRQGLLKAYLGTATRLFSPAQSGLIFGPPPGWASDTTITLPVGMGGLSDDGVDILEITSTAGAQTVNISTTGANGLDTGSVSTGWYYLWLIKNPTNGQVRGLLSTSSTAPTLPSGFTRKILLPCDVYYASTAIRRFSVLRGWPYSPTIVWLDVNFNINAPGGAFLVYNSTVTGTWTTVTPSTLVSPRAKAALLASYVSQGGGGSQLLTRVPSSTVATGRPIAYSIFTSYASNTLNDCEVPVESQAFQIRADNAGLGFCLIWNNGFIL